MIFVEKSNGFLGTFDDLDFPVKIGIECSVHVKIYSQRLSVFRLGRNRDCVKGGVKEGETPPPLVCISCYEY